MAICTDTKYTEGFYQIVEPPQFLKDVFPICRPFGDPGDDKSYEFGSSYWSGFDSTSRNEASSRGLSNRKGRLKDSFSVTDKVTNKDWNCAIVKLKQEFAIRCGFKHNWIPFVEQTGDFGLSNHLGYFRDGIKGGSDGDSDPTQGEKTDIVYRRDMQKIYLDIIRLLDYEVPMYSVEDGSKNPRFPEFRGIFSNDYGKVGDYNSILKEIVDIDDADKFLKQGNNVFLPPDNKASEKKWKYFHLNDNVIGYPGEPASSCAKYEGKLESFGDNYPPGGSINIDQLNDWESRYTLGTGGYDFKKMTKKRILQFIGASQPWYRKSDSLLDWDDGIFIDYWQPKRDTDDFAYAQEIVPNTYYPYGNKDYTEDGGAGGKEPKPSALYKAVQEFRKKFINPAKETTDNDLLVSAKISKTATVDRDLYGNPITQTVEEDASFSVAYVMRHAYTEFQTVDKYGDDGKLISRMTIGGDKIIVDANSVANVFMKTINKISDICVCNCNYCSCFGNEVTCLCYVVKVTGWCYSYMYVY